MTWKPGGRKLAMECDHGRTEAWKRAPWAAVIIKLAKGRYQAFEDLDDYAAWRGEKGQSSDNESCE
jgi:hypothetical protein